MDDEEAGPSTRDPLNIMDMLRDGPLTVVDQAAEEAIRYPECNNMLSGRMLGVPSSVLRPCKTCCGINTQDGSPSNNSRNYTPEEIENMTETCSAHFENQLLLERAMAKSVLEARLAKKAKQEQARLAKEAKLAKAVKKKDQKKAKSKAKIELIEVEPLKMEVDEDDIDEYLYEAEITKKKKVTRWLCPECSKSSKFGSCGCVGCGEWYHFVCAGFKSAKEVPASWSCQYCK